MLSSKHSRFSWSKQDRAPEVSFFRMLHQNWRPTSRVVVVDDQLVTYGRHGRKRGTSAQRAASKPVWTPWLWVGS